MVVAALFVLEFLWTHRKNKKRTVGGNAQPQPVRSLVKEETVKQETVKQETKAA